MLGSRLQETTADLNRLRDIENYQVPEFPAAHSELSRPAGRAPAD